MFFRACNPNIIFLFYRLQFFGSLVNHAFSNLKLDTFIITDFICSNKFMEQEVLINYSWISPHITKDMEIGVVFILQKFEKGTFFTKKRERLVK